MLAEGSFIILILSFLRRNRNSDFPLQSHEYEYFIFFSWDKKGFSIKVKGTSGILIVFVLNRTVDARPEMR